MQNKQLQAVAYHEAGRAVEAYLAGRKIDYVENGRVVFDASWYEQACKSEDVLKLEMDTELDICLAGIAAEELYVGEKYKPNFEKAKEIAKYLVNNPADIDSFIEKQYNEAKKMWKWHWEIIERVAKFLIELIEDNDGCGGDFLSEVVIGDAVAIMGRKQLNDGTWADAIKDISEIDDKNLLEQIEEIQRQYQEWYNQMFDESGRIRFDAILQNSNDNQ